VWLRVEGEKGQQSGIGKKLSEKGLVNVFPLVDLVAVGTIFSCVCPVIGLLCWFVLLQKRH